MNLLTTESLDRFRQQRTVLLTTFKRDGTGVDTPVSIAVDGERAFIRSWSTAGKAKRLRRDSHARIAPSTARGKPTGSPVDVELHLVKAEDAGTARKLLRRKHPILHGVLVPVMHRLARYSTVHYEVTRSP
jgi:PPOX class probable F420-dependent enzyme